MRIGGLIPFSTVDWPGQLAAVVFCQGCPWRCRYCQNPHLQPAGTPSAYRWQDVLAFLERRRGLLDAVVFSGGEPVLQADLPEAVQAVRALGYRVGLHTAGIYPRRIERLLPLVDWVGLDIKAPARVYAQLTGVPNSAEAAFTSLRLLQTAGVAYELRCTWHPHLLTAQDMTELGLELAVLGEDRLVVQECRPHGCAQTLGEAVPGPETFAGVRRHLRLVSLRP